MFEVIFIIVFLYIIIFFIWFYFCYVFSYRDFRKMIVGWLWNVEFVFIEDYRFKFDILKECYVLFIYMISICFVSFFSLENV